MEQEFDHTSDCDSINDHVWNNPIGQYSNLGRHKPKSNTTYKPRTIYSDTNFNPSNVSNDAFEAGDDFCDNLSSVGFLSNFSSNDCANNNPLESTSNTDIHHNWKRTKKMPASSAETTANKNKFFDPKRIFAEVKKAIQSDVMNSEKSSSYTESKDEELDLRKLHFDQEIARKLGVISPDEEWPIRTESPLNIGKHRQQQTSINRSENVGPHASPDQCSSINQNSLNPGKQDKSNSVKTHRVNTSPDQGCIITSNNSASLGKRENRNSSEKNVTPHRLSSSLDQGCPSISKTSTNLGERENQNSLEKNVSPHRVSSSSDQGSPSISNNSSLGKRGNSSDRNVSPHRLSASPDQSHPIASKNSSSLGEREHRNSSERNVSPHRLTSSLDQSCPSISKNPSSLGKRESSFERNVSPHRLSSSSNQGCPITSKNPSSQGKRGTSNNEKTFSPHRLRSSHDQGCPMTSDNSSNPGKPESIRNNPKETTSETKHSGSRSNDIQFNTNAARDFKQRNHKPAEKQSSEDAASRAAGEPRAEPIKKKPVPKGDNERYLSKKRRKPKFANQPQNQQDNGNRSARADRSDRPSSRRSRERQSHMNHERMDGNMDEEVREEAADGSGDALQQLFFGIIRALVWFLGFLFFLFLVLLSFAFNICRRWLIYTMVFLKVLMEWIRKRSGNKFRAYDGTLTMEDIMTLGPSENILLPTEGDKAVERLLKCDKDDPYEVLGVSARSPDDDVKKYYRKQCILVHPDKNTMEGAEEAFKILHRAFEVIGDPAKRAGFHEAIIEHAQKEMFQKEFTEQFRKIRKVLEERENMINCVVCGGTHKRYVTDRPVYAARYCARHDARHAATEGDIWAESTHFGFRWHFYTCMDHKIYDVTEWAKCQNLGQMQSNAHAVRYRFDIRKNRNRPAPPQPPPDFNDEEFFEELFRQAQNYERSQTTQNTPNSNTNTNHQRKHKKKHRKKKGF
ncbi:uncharacterized protein [Antedon mediterranea]|uniref:uncharacterized protein n=1 Tax=Antedon mediterranea TaxID=105859 RepID=UPI003AF82653